MGIIVVILAFGFAGYVFGGQQLMLETLAVGCIGGALGYTFGTVNGAIWIVRRARERERKRRSQ